MNDDPTQKIRDFAKEIGWELASSQQSWGGKGHSGVALLVKSPTPLGDAYDENYSWTLGLVGDAMKQVELHNHREDPERPKREAKIREDLLKCFTKISTTSRYGQAVYVREIPNEYWGEMGEPWLIVTTEIGHVKIGWRKRVIEIDWSDTDIKSSAEDLFPDENVTKIDKMIHAWGYEKATEYIKKLHSSEVVNA